MALIVFMRGVNVGGHKSFQPSVLAKELAEFDVVNIGAAGTFVVRKKISPTALRDEFLKKLKFEAQMMICRESALTKLSSGDPFRGELGHKDIKGYVTVLEKRPGKLLTLPICQPDGEEWQVKIFGVRGLFVLSLHRRMGPRLVYPNEVVEKRFGVPATTRNWNTITAILKCL